MTTVCALYICMVWVRVMRATHTWMNRREIYLIAQTAWLGACIHRGKWKTIGFLCDFVLLGDFIDFSVLSCEIVISFLFAFRWQQCHCIRLARNTHMFGCVIRFDVMLFVVHLGFLFYFLGAILYAIWFHFHRKWIHRFVASAGRLLER